MNSYSIEPQCWPELLSSFTSTEESALMTDHTLPPARNVKQNGVKSWSSILHGQQKRHIKKLEFPTQSNTKEARTEDVATRVCGDWASQ